MLKTIKIIVLLTGIAGISWGQNFDSLRGALVGKKGVARCDVYFALLKAYADKENLTALSYGDSAYVVALALGDSLRIAKSLRYKGQILRRLDRTSEAITVFQKSIDISSRKGFVDEHSIALNSLALVYTFTADYYNALKTHFECLLLRQMVGEKEEIAVTLSNIGLLYYKLENWEKALEYYQKAYQIKTEGNYERNILLVNMGLCYAYAQQCDEALRRINEGIRSCSNCEGNFFIYSNFALGFTYQSESKYDSAEFYYMKSHKLSLKYSDKRFEIENLLQLAFIKQEFGEPSKAIEYLTQAEPLAILTGYGQLRLNIYEEYSNIYTKKKDWKTAVSYLNKYVSLKDTLYNEDLLKNISRIQTEFEERENRAKILLQEQILTLKEIAIERQRLLSILIGFVAFLLVGLAIILYRINRQKHQLNILLDQKVKERTIALVQSIDALMRSQQEQSNLIRSATHDLRASVATMKGLCDVASMEISIAEVYDEYLLEFRATANKFDIVIDRLQFVDEKLSHTPLPIK